MNTAPKRRGFRMSANQILAGIWAAAFCGAFALLVGNMVTGFAIRFLALGVVVVSPFTFLGAKMGQPALGVAVGILLMVAFVLLIVFLSPLRV